MPLSKIIHKYLEFKSGEYKFGGIQFVIFIFTILSPLFFMMYLPLLQNYIYGEHNDFVFPVYSIYIFPVSACFTLLFAELLVRELLITIPKIKNIFAYKKESNLKSEEKYYREMNIRLNIFITILFVIALFFSIVSFPVHVRINNDTGLFYTKIFTLKEKNYSWDKLESVLVHPGKKSLSPEMLLEFDGHKLDIWNGAGLGSPDSKMLIETIDMIHRNTELEIVVKNSFTGKMMDALYNIVI